MDRKYRFTLIHRVRYLVDDQVIQEFTGHYLYCMVQRDFSECKKNLFDKMTGNVVELNDPANYSNRNGNYPNASYNGYSKAEWPYGVEPSIRGKELYIPLNNWSTLSSKMAIPLVSMQYSQLYIEVECRAIEDLYVVRDIDFFLKIVSDPSFSDPSYNSSRGITVPYIHPEQKTNYNKLYYFLYEPPEGSVGIQAIGKYDEHYSPWFTNWAADIHLLATYVFLSDEEVRIFTGKCQSYLIRDVHEQTIYNRVGKQRTNIETAGLVASWMWFFQRSDVNLRNEWSNYSNWPYKDQPYPPTRSIRYSYLVYIYEHFISSGNLTNFINNYPNEFVVIYLAFITYPIQSGICPLITPFHPPCIEPYFPYQDVAPNTNNLPEVTSLCPMPKSWPFMDPTFMRSLVSVPLDGTNIRFPGGPWWGILGVPTPPYWSEDFDAYGTYQEMKENWGLIVGPGPSSVPCPSSCTPSGTLADIYITGEQHIENERNIMTEWGLYLDRTVRETVFDSGVVNYIDKYVRTAGYAKSGIYCYNFCLSTDPFNTQPSGAINISKFDNIAFQYTILEPIDGSFVSVSVTCDSSGIPIDEKLPATSASKDYWKIFQYSYNLHIMEERYNIFLVENGLGRLALAR